MSPRRDPAAACPLCGRTCELTFHHLIPKKMHRRERYRKRYSREQRATGIGICRLCHDGIHDLYDEQTLAERFPDLAALRSDPAIRRHCAWVARQKVRG
ncbi:MAG: hypothetical protein ACOCZK_06140 [Planctomycetota bacterium]